MARTSLPTESHPHAPGARSVSLGRCPRTALPSPTALIRDLCRFRSGGGRTAESTEPPGGIGFGRGHTAGSGKTRLEAVGGAPAAPGASRSDRWRHPGEPALGPLESRAHLAGSRQSTGQQSRVSGQTCASSRALQSGRMVLLPSQNSRYCRFAAISSL